MRALRRSQTSLGSNNTTPSPSSPSSSSSSSSWIPLRSVLLIVASSSSSSSSPVSSDRGSLKSPWSRRRRKHALLAKQWKSLFDVDGKLSDGGVKFLKKIRTGGVEPSIRAEVWPFLLGFYDVKSSNKERETIRAQKRREYVELRRQCRQIIKRGERSFKLKEMSGNNSNEDNGYVSQVLDSPSLDEVASARPSISMEVASLSGEVVSKDGHSAYLNTSRDLAELEEDDGVITNDNASEDETNSSVSESSDDPEDTKPLLGSMDTEDNNPYEPVASIPDKLETQNASYKTENFATWRRIIRLDAIRANAEWIIYSPSQAEVSEEKARKRAESVELKDYDNLEPCRIYHAARLVAILEAYAVYDPEIGYCQGMSDLLSPIISVIEEDHVAFWCFVGFMRKARHNFRLDEVGIRRQLNIVSKIIKCKDSHLYNHLEKLQAEDCFFVYRMVVVLFRRELTFEQTLCLWEVMWADQAAIRAGIVKSAWRRMRLRAPPTDDLLLYAIAACVLQRRKLIIENYSSMDEIMRECNSMAEAPVKTKEPSIYFSFAKDDRQLLCVYLWVYYVHCPHSGLPSEVATSNKIVRHTYGVFVFITWKSLYNEIA
ncbi:UNVERIFIED_CONTAM: GTPase-activating protein GYP7 [Sesamum indicum]